jgi:O-antigen/teichoic acid export membrane protein
VAGRTAELAPVTAADTRPPESPDDRKGELRSLARGGALNLAGAGISGVANLGLTVIVARVFTKYDAGVFFSATSLFLILLAAADLGTSTGLVYFIARFRALGEPERIRGTLRQALVPLVITSLVLAGLLAGLAPWLARWLVAGDVASGVRDLRILAVFLPFATLLNACLAGTQGFRVMRATVLVEKLTRPSLQLLLVIASGLFGAGAVMLPLAWAGPYLPAAIAAAVWLGVLAHRASRPVRDGETHRSASPGADGFWRFTGPRALAGVAQIAIQRLDIVLVSALRGPVDAALYTAATRFLVVGQLVAQALNQAVQPRLSELLARGDTEGAAGVYQTSTAWLIVLTWPLYLLAASFSWFVLAIFGKGYDTGAPVMIILSLAMLVATACGMVDIVLTMAGKTTWNLYNYLAALAVNVVVNVIAIPPLGILGAAIGWAVALLVKNLLPLTQIWVTLRLHPFSRASLTACALAAVSFGAIPLAVRLIFGSGAIPLAAATLGGLLVYAAGLWRARYLLHLDAMPILGRLVRAR